jgi:hypothetical protein
LQLAGIAIGETNIVQLGLNQLKPEGCGCEISMRLDQSSVDLSTLVMKIERGEIDLQPDFQRGQVWTDAKKKRLIDTILREWYVPAIHIVVNDALDKEEILDGQQRIRSILEFVNDKLQIDGRIQPEDKRIVSLDGLRYSELPDSIRSRFKRFAITTVRLRDYRPEEPGELFFRLNQLTALTAAEQRNALVGQPRNQVRRLAAMLEEAVGARKIGFSNARMNYDDVLSRLATVLEVDRLGEKLTASSLERRYRLGTAFSGRTIKRIQQSINQLAIVLQDHSARIRLNKASLFSWLFFVADYDLPGDEVSLLEEFFATFESARSTYQVDLLNNLFRPNLPSRLDENATFRECVVIFNDRSSSRVNDVSSVLLRDLCLNLAFYVAGKKVIRNLRSMKMRASFLSSVAERFNKPPTQIADRLLMETELARQWESRREALTP